jgi:DNA replication protein DnaC
MTRDPGNAEAIEIAEGILKSTSGGIVYLSGEAGTGKTWIAAALCRSRILALQPARFIRSNDLLNSIRAGFRVDTEVVDPFKALPFIVIDDLGAECFTDWSVGYWYDLIDYRYNWLLPTVITSNLPLKDLKTKVSARVVSRIAESSMGVKLTGKDRRTGG